MLSEDNSELNSELNFPKKKTVKLAEQPRAKLAALPKLPKPKQEYVWLTTDAEAALESQAAQIVRNNFIEMTKVAYYESASIKAAIKAPTNREEYIALLQLAVRLANKVNDDVSKIENYLSRHQSQSSEADVIADVSFTPTPAIPSV